MAVAAAEIIHRAEDILQDITGVRWGADELTRYLNDGQREVAVYRPDAFVLLTPLALIGGPRQTLPAGSVKLLDVPNNVAAPQSAIGLVERRLLDDFAPAWRSMASAATIKQFMYDPRAPLVFEVYPPATAGTVVNVLCAVEPTAIAEPAANTTYASVVGNINVSGIFANALLDYVLYRAYSKDSEYAADAQRAATAYAAFAGAMGIEVKATAVVTPAPTGP